MTPQSPTSPPETEPVQQVQWVLKGRCYKLGHDVPHPGGVVPSRIIIGRHFDAADIIPHLFEETDPGFHTRCKPGDIIVTGTPSGAGARFEPPRYLEPGDVIEVEADGIGVLRNGVVDEAE